MFFSVSLIMIHPQKFCKISDTTRLIKTGVAIIAEKKSKPKITIKTPITGVSADKMIKVKKNNKRDIP
tara:strand:- start:3899 stop:4102 length:204 start_codon:yes stop_codon:yes gene_type:complete